MRWADIKEGKDDSGSFLEFRERVTKTRTGVKNDARAIRPRAYANDLNPKRCPVMLYRAYASHRPLPMMDDDAPFYLAVNNMNTDPNNPRKWYKCSALGPNTIGTFVKVMAKEAGLTAKYTNHSIRKTACTNLLRAGFAPTHIQQISGHKDVKSLTSYAKVSNDQVREMNRVLANPQSIGKYPVATVSVPEERRNQMAVVEPEEGAIAPSENEPVQLQNEPVKACTATMMMRNTSGLFQNTKFEHCTFNFTLLGSNNS